MVESRSGAGAGAGVVRAAGGESCMPPEGCMDCVRATALGAELSDAQLLALRGAIEVNMLSPGETLVREGEHDYHLYAVAAGEVEVLQQDASGRKPSARRLGPGGVIGELAFVEGRRCEATLRARDDACVVSLHRDELEGLLSVDPSLVYKIMRSLVRSAHRPVDAGNAAVPGLAH